MTDDTPDDPYTRTPDELAAAVDDALAAADADVARIVATGGHGTFAEVLGPLEDVADRLGRVYGTTGFLGHVHNDAQVRAAGRVAEQRLATWEADLAFRDDLFATVSAFGETDEAATLQGEEARLLTFLRRDFRRAGHELAPAARARVRELTTRLVELGVTFETNIADDPTRLLVHPDELDGMPDDWIASLAPSPADDRRILTMAYPDVVPVMDLARDRGLRARVHRAFNSRAEVPNRPILDEAVAIRAEIARLFDRPSWAHLQLEHRMAETPERVEAFLDRLRGPLTEGAVDELARMQELLEADGDHPPVQAFDWRFYDTQQRRTDHGVDQAEVAEYFPLEQVTEGLLDLTAEVFGLVWEPVDVHTWDDDVVSLVVRDADSGERLGLVHMDLFPREGTFSHAAAFPLVPARRLADGSWQRPEVAIVANFPRPTDDRPSLLTHRDVETYFHEFGHVLHGVLTRAELVRFSGVANERDFVEAPSQIMEHWTWQSDVLARFAFHFDTGEPIPGDLVSRLVEARRLNVGLATLRQLQFALLDLRLHDATSPKDLDAIDREAADVTPFPPDPDTFFPASFGHLMGGYDAGYYGYLWSEVYGDDMFSRFEAEGVTSPSVGRDYRRAVLEPGGTHDAIELLRDFLGRDPDDRAFLRKLGLAD
ncbi:M3 family metallopeptidase [Salsipaludibacter albus]|uniref:M3 family metallopeptidase n=1 Tax=Salsipaludibacter albus TaxID=2849650 RepID=UPI001EE42BFF|nr:M3 family metallopeptidase [Salsipaludibacter albus]MBY5162940.1 Zn-dependent oligopeptidase [Salsipaludibacter albus]